MGISKINLSSFRNFRKKTISFSPKITVIVGPNASGKTNILEALYLLSTGKSFRARLQEEMINYNAEIARVSAELGIKNYELGEKIHNTKYIIQNTNLEVVLTRGEITVGEDPKKVERAPRKKMLVNGVSRRLFNFAGNFKVVLFAPEHLDIVTESPSVRRNFLDTVLSQTDREYRRAVLSYEKGLRQRNRLLWQIREDSSTHAERLGRARLLFWDKLLIKNGDYISSSRADFIDYINETPDFNGHDFSVEYDKSAISESRLEQYKEEEIAAATTLVGPHRDDFVIRVKVRESGRVKERELARFGSRGEQRMGTLWLKLAELSFIEQESGEKPTLLLDDIFSELDHKHREIVMNVVKGYQTVITAADPHFVENFKGVEKIVLS